MCSLNKTTNKVGVMKNHDHYSIQKCPFITISRWDTCRMYLMVNTMVDYSADIKE